ncbi:hypothetical protein [Clostridium neonatale]|uniref:hypothetical protein n=1 Tax=Clostridium neonatale TaxID=137838 RepID=UPI001B35B39E|nr:hypothetical protein [Clostridium neonatale]
MSKYEYKRRDRVYQKATYTGEKAEYRREYYKNKYQEQLKAEGKLTEKEMISQRRLKIKDLLQEGLKRKDICSQLNISIKTYKRDISSLKEQGLV